MKKYSLSFLYCLAYLVTFLLGFCCLSSILDKQTYQIVVQTVLFLSIGMSFFISVWFRLDELFFLIFLSLCVYVVVGYFAFTPQLENTYYHQLGFPLICILYPLNVYAMFHISPKDSVFWSFLKNFIILMIEVAVIYFFTYFIPVLFGAQFVALFQTKISALLNFTFGLTELSFTLPLVSVLIFVMCFILLALKKLSKSTQIQASILSLFFITYVSFFFVDNRFVFPLCYLAGSANVLFSLLQVSHKMAFLDELTNVAGRRALMTELKKIEKEDYSLAMIDIDFFKRLNDSYGHEVGDQGLRMIAASLAEHSCGGTLYRYGGEEFVLLFPHCKLDEILDNLENARELISNANFFLRPKKNAQTMTGSPYLASIKITLSVGVTQKRDGQSYDDVINIADQALYKAKQTGRNKTVYNKDGRYYELF